MSDADNFLTRWSRRKRAVAEESSSDANERRAPDAAEAADHAPDAEARPAGTLNPVPDAQTRESPAPFDISKLPSIESITADTDIRAFFAPGVPAELAHAALRRAWVADPMVRDFVGLAENSWDFNNPESIPGFGPLEMTDELRREAARMFDHLVPKNEPASPAPAATSEPALSVPQPTEASTEINTEPPGAAAVVPSGASSSLDHPASITDESEPAEPSVQRKKEIVASQHSIEPRENLQTSARRGHGRALPK